MAYRILIVDDEPALQSMVGEILTQAGYATAAALSCRQALEQFRTFAPDAVLLDVMLPDGDGFSLLGQLRQARDLPVLFLSARDEDEARLHGLGLGASPNPFCPRSCCSGCGRYCGGSTGRNPRLPGWGKQKSTGARAGSAGATGRFPSPPKNLPC